MSHDPRRHSGPCMIRVIVREGLEPGEGEIVHDKTGDHSENYFRDWVFNTEWWALRNGHNVVKYPLEDYTPGRVAQR